MAGRDTYQTSASENNVWKLGYSKKSIVPDDIDSGKYNLGRDLLNKYAQGVYDDQCIRVAVIDDNSGEGAVVLGAIDSLGVTSTDIRTIRKAVLDYCESHGIKVASINISATHAHSALDTQGVSTEFFKKLFGAFWCNLIGFDGTMAGLETAENFKKHFIGVSVEAERKPNPVNVLKVLDAFGITADECIYVGDSEVDVQTAHNAGVKCIGVTWGFRDEAELKENGADFIAHNTEEVLNHVM
jgi:hypothetical protein